MRLINCKTLQLESDWAGPTPRYAILSHTWAVDGSEVTLQDYQAGRDHPQASTKNWQKIDCTIQLADYQNIGYVWIDSCCIDKTNNAELSESINSMFKWYAAAAVCYVNLQDFAAGFAFNDASLDPILATQLSGCRWFQRGWTLQELIAPSYVEFYDMNWVFMGTRDGLSGTLSQITNIDREVLANPADGRSRDLNHVLSQVPVARKMSWASSRETKRIEDEGYSLLGIFGVNMPMMYGEGDQAFIRLQEEILRNINDMTIFAWTETPDSNNGTVSEYRGVLARSPGEFHSAGTLFQSLGNRVSPVYTMTNKGLQIRTQLHPLADSRLMFMALNCHETDQNGVKQSKGVLLQFQGAGTYVRSRPDRLESYNGGNIASTSTATEKDIYITKNVVGPRATATIAPATAIYQQQHQYHLHPGISDVDGSSSHERLLSNVALQLTPPPPPSSTHSYPLKEMTAVSTVISNPSMILPSNHHTSTDINRDSLRLDIQGAQYIQHIWSADEAHWHDVDQAFITTGIPDFCGFVRFRTKGACGEGVNDFLLVCGLEETNEDEDDYNNQYYRTNYNNYPQHRPSYSAAAMVKKRKPWICLASSHDPLFTMQESGRLEGARQLALQKRNLSLGFKEMNGLHWARAPRFSDMKRLSKGLTVVSSTTTVNLVEQQQQQHSENEGKGRGRYFVIKVEAQPWKGKRKIALWIWFGVFVLLVGAIVGVAVGITTRNNSRFEAASSNDYQW